MAERSARLDSILGSMTDGLWVYDANGAGRLRQRSGAHHVRLRLAHRGGRARIVRAVQPSLSRRPADSARRSAARARAARHDRSRLPGHRPALHHRQGSRPLHRRGADRKQRHRRRGARDPRHHRAAGARPQEGRVPLRRLARAAHAADDDQGLHAAARADDQRSAAPRSGRRTSTRSSARSIG